MLIVLFTGTVLVSTAVALVRLPRWFVRSAYRHRLWRLRDRVADDVLAGTLPNHPAIRALIDELEGDIRKFSQVSILDLIILRRFRRSLSASAAEALRAAVTGPSGRGLGQQAKARLECYREEQAKTVAQAILLGSWCGLLTLSYFVPITILQVSRETGRVAAGKAWSAAAEAASRTRLGQSTVAAVRERSSRVTVGA